MMYLHNKSLVKNARALRKNMTKEERHLWYDFLRGHEKRIMRQKIIGPYIVDFYCAAEKIVIELDGSQHYEDIGITYDARRTAYLEEQGLRVVRLANNQINENFEGVCQYLEQMLSGK